MSVFSRSWWITQAPELSCNVRSSSGASSRLVGMDWEVKRLGIYRRVSEPPRATSGSDWFMHRLVRIVRFFTLGSY